MTNTSADDVSNTTGQSGGGNATPATTQRAQAVIRLFNGTQEIPIIDGEAEFPIETPALFDGEASAGENLTFTWEFDDGYILEGPQANRTFTQYRTVLVRLLARVENATADVAQLRLHVVPLEPARPAAPVDAARTFTLTGTTESAAVNATEPLASVTLAVVGAPARISIWASWGDAPGASGPIDIDVDLYDPHGMLRARAATSHFEFLEVDGTPLLLSDGNWTVLLRPEAPMVISYRLDIVLWFQRPAQATFSGMRHNATTLNETDRFTLALPNQASTIMARLVWKDVAAGQEPCDSASRGAADFDLSIERSGAAQRSSADSLACEFAVVDGPADASFGLHPWSISVQPVLVKQASFSLIVDYA